MGKRTKLDIDATPGPITLAITVKTANGPVPMAMVFGLQAAIEGATIDELRDASQLPVTNDVMPVYIRPAMGGVTEITGMRPGAHTICATQASMFDTDAKAAVKCVPIKLDAATPKRSLDVVLPK